MAREKRGRLIFILFCFVLVCFILFNSLQFYFILFNHIILLEWLDLMSLLSKIGTIRLKTDTLSC